MPTELSTLKEIARSFGSGGASVVDSLRTKYGSDALMEAADYIDQVRSRAIDAQPGFMDRLAAGTGKDATEEAQIYRDRGFLASVGETAPGAFSSGLASLTGGFVGGQPEETVFIDTPAGRKRADPQGFDSFSEFGNDIADAGGMLLNAIPPAVAGTAGFLASGGNPLATRLAVGAGAAGMGGIVGENVRQSTAALAGGEQEPDLGRIGTEGLINAATEPLAGMGSALVKRAVAPMRASVTKPIRDNVIDPAKQFAEQTGIDVLEHMPVSGMSENPGLHAAEQRIREGMWTADTYTKNVIEPFEESIKELFGTLQARVGVPARGGQTTGEAVRSAAEQASVLRTEQIGRAFDAIDAQVDPTMVVRPQNATGALEELSRSSRANPKFSMTSEASEQVARWMSDLENVETYADLKVLREAVGATMNSPQRMDPFMRSGVNADVARFYGALLRDVEQTLPSHLVPQEAAARGLHQSAKKLEQSSAQRATLRNEDKASTITDKINSRNFTPEEVMRERQIIGEQGTAAGLKSTPEGGDAWRQVQAESLELLRQASINPNRTLREGLSGERMVSYIERIGGLPKLIAIHGEELGTDIQRYAVMLRESNVGNRTQANTSRSSQGVEWARDMARLFTNPMALGASTLGKIGIGHGLTSKTGRKYLTEGAFQDATSQNFLSNVGRATARSTINENRK